MKIHKKVYTIFLIGGTILFSIMYGITMWLIRIFDPNNEKNTKELKAISKGDAEDPQLLNLYKSSKYVIILLSIAFWIFIIKWIYSYFLK